MIVTTDIGNILYRDCDVFGIEKVALWDKPKSELISEKVTVATQSLSTDKNWKKSVAEVNLYVPDLTEAAADAIRLNELERQACSVLDNVASSYDGTAYRYSIDSIGIEADTALKCHYVNVKVLFEILNVRKL